MVMMREVPAIRPVEIRRISCRVGSENRFDVVLIIKIQELVWLTFTNLFSSCLNQSIFATIALQ